jgi:cytochrome c553
MRRKYGVLLAALLGAGLACAQTSPSNPATVANTLEQRLLACAMCHGKQGEGVRKNEYYPRLAGKPSEYLYSQLIGFREKRRASPVMTYMVGALSDSYLGEIADYYSTLRPPFPPPARAVDPLRLARGEALALKGDPALDIPACTACHGAKLSGMLPGIPGLVGLYPDYIAAQMGAWKNGVRNAAAPDCMARIASRLSGDDVAAVSAWLASLPASPDTPPTPARSLKLPMSCGSAPQ